MTFINIYSRPNNFIRLSIPLLILLTITPILIKADLPIHCKREEIEGEWVFRINNNFFEPSLADYRSTCGHGFPDKIEKLDSDINYAFDDFKDINLFLGKDYRIYDPISNEIKGKWTPVYDEGFIVNFENSVFTAFMKYYLKPVLSHKINTNKNAKNEDYLSNCQKTMIGWFIKDQNENTKNWSCFFGFKKNIAYQFNYKNQKNNNHISEDYSKVPKKVFKPNKNFSQFRFYYFNKKTKKYDKENDDEDENLPNTDIQKNFPGKIKNGSFLKNRNNQDNQSNSFANINFDLLDMLENNSFLEIKSQTGTKNQMRLKLESLKYEDQSDLINEINSNKLSWTAHIHNDFKGLSFLDLKMKLGLRSTNEERSFSSHKESSQNKMNSKSNKEIISGEKIKSNEQFNKFSNPKTFNKKNNLKIQKISQENNFKNKQVLNSESSQLDLPSVLLAIKTEESSETIFTTMNESLLTEEISKRDEDSENVNSFDEISKYIDKELDEIDENALPNNWDWRNVGGVNYVPEPRMQENCGSCYVFSMITSLESRLRVMTNNQDKTIFSRQFPISCNFYTEGCSGGYPILVAKFSSEFELIPESCFEYKPNNSKCSDVCDFKKFQKKYFVTKYEYLGGYYGNTNEIEIMKEIRARGPIPGNMTVPWSFSYYKSGIYSQNEIKSNAGNLSKTTMLDNHLSWSSVDHSILLVGYGEENGVKFWIGMNTWGKSWGENGFFRILRGENDCNIETMGDAARVSFKIR